MSRWTAERLLACVHTHPNPRRWTFEVAFALLSLSVAWPLFIGRYPPIQDLPQHAAAVRVLHDYTTEGLNLERWFDVDLARTQYLSVYVIADLLAYVVGPVFACKLILAGSLVATPYAMRALLSAVGTNPSYALLVLPLSYNAHTILGFLNFLMGIPLMLWGMAIAVQLRADAGDAPPWRIPNVWRLAAILLLTFYTHVVPFGMLCLAVGLLAPVSEWRRLRGWALACLPALLALGWWASNNPAGRSVAAIGQVLTSEEAPRAQHAGVEKNLAEAPRWLLDVLHGEQDTAVLVAWLLLVLAAWAAGAAPRTAWARRLGWLVPAAVTAYFLAPVSFDWIWPINARFPILALLLLIPTLPRLRSGVAAALLVVVAALTGVATVTVAQAFERCEQREYAGLHELIGAIPPGQKVAGLIWARGSKHVKFAPFIHSAAWYQAEKGGAVMFTFADFPQSPFYFYSNDRPPRVPPRWEWQPGAVDTREDLTWFDFVITRGGPARLAGYRRTRHEGAWRLFTRE